ncbi:MAG: hypothetical protein JO316_26035 [Abitibacteriaceae bacterium]|nr:hypothetical protein [Abditibacteriaceae bacterium]MBV9868820.1 hypothetical protein [Abditibacteriaceae bacterium]
MDDPILIQQLNLLLTGYGYNLYNVENRARADDLLVRQQACTWLGQAAAQLAQLATDYSQRYIPTATREQPFPPAANLAQLREIKALGDAVSLLDSRIRGMAVPTQDKVWSKFRQESVTLHRLLTFDYQLIAGAKALHDSLSSLTIDEWTNEQAAALRARLHDLETSARQREAFLVTPF